MEFRQMWTALVGMFAVALLVSGCGLWEEPDEPPVAEIAVNPGDGAQDVSPGETMRTSVERGKVDHVTLTSPEGELIEGEIAPDQTTWRATEQLEYGSKYTWAGTAVGTDGKKVPVGGEFRTVQPADTVRATIDPTDGDEVGVGMPISVNFDQPVEDKAAVERALEVHPSEPVEGAWAWLSDEQVDWRPKEYWPPHTHVRVDANLYGVPFGDGAYGVSDASSEFDIGRQQIVKADVQSNQLAVEQDGEEIANYAASYGDESDPGRRTRNGTYIVMERNPVQTMTNPQYGYFDETYTWAVRFSNHGEFIHENEENASNLGVANTSHGCVNLSSSNAKEYFDSAMLGDPVEVTGSASDMEPGYDVYDWLLDWDEWQTMSALHQDS